MSQTVYLKLATFSSRVCRGCLAADVPLYDMHQNNLMDAYSTLLNTDVTDELPHYLCSDCATLLLKCNTFRNKCIDALFILRNVQHGNVQLSTDHIIKSLSTLEQETIKQEYYDIDIPSVSNEVKDCGTKNILKDDPVTYSINTDHDYVINKGSNQLLNKFPEDKGRMKQLSEIVNHIQYLSETSNKNKDFNVPITETIQGNVNEHNKPNIKKSEEMIANTTFKASESLTVSVYNLDIKNEVSKEIPTCIPITYEDNGPLNVSNEVELSQDPMDFSDEENKSNLELKENIADLKNKTKKKPLLIHTQYGCKRILKSLRERQQKIKDFKEKGKEFEAKYNLEVTYFSKEEQLKEIEDRRKSRNYKEMKFKCNLCYKGFIIEETYNNHMMLHNDISGKFVCDICHYHFTTSTMLKKHKCSHSQLFTCKKCGFTTKHSHLATQHSEWHTGKKHSCKECGKEFRNNSSQYGHIKLHHPTSEQLVRCEICEDSFNGPTGLKYHDKKAHKEMNSPQCYCSGCNTQFYCSDAFKAHQGADGLCITTHKYCVRCGMSFETEQLLNEHEIEQRKPRKISLYKCDICSKTFNSIATYKIHSRQHNNMIRSYYNKKTKKKQKKEDCLVCEVCGKVLQNKGFLKIHNDIIHKGIKIACTLCPKKFSTNMHLKVHIRTHTGERPFQCDRCPKAFKSSYNLSRHQLIHTGERPHSCDICGKSFQSKHGVKLHIQAIHMKLPMPPRIRRRNKKTK